MIGGKTLRICEAAATRNTISGGNGRRSEGDRYSLTLAKLFVRFCTQASLFKTQRGLHDEARKNSRAISALKRESLLTRLCCRCPITRRPTSCAAPAWSKRTHMRRRTCARELGAEDIVIPLKRLSEIVERRHRQCVIVTKAPVSRT